jgi:type II secretory pathway component GspD/PulD (secretin)
MKMRDGHRSLCQIAAAALLSLTAVRAIADEAITEVIPLAARLPEEVIPVIQPLAGPDGAVTAFGGRLIVRATPERLEEIRQVLAEIDRPPKRLVIHVRHRRAAQGAGTSGAPGTDIRFRDLRTRGEHDAQERAQTVDGQPAFIRYGVSVPVPAGGLYEAAPGIVQPGGVDFRDATTGFWVTPRVVGQEILLDISHDATNPGPSPLTFSVREAAGTLRVRPGEWTSLGGVSGSAAAEGLGLLRRHGTARESDFVIEVMVEVLASGPR